MLTRCLGCMEEYDPALGVCPHCGFVPGTPAEEAIHMNPGTVLHGRYLIGKVLGYGGFGVTYIGWDSKLEQKVAIKEYLPGEFSTRMPGRSQVSVFSGDKAEQFADGMHKFVEEARRLAMFQKEPGIVTVFDSFEENNTAYIVMEYLDGETLTDYLKREGRIQEDEAVAMLMPLMESLEKVHAQGILHRDIAPDNIFLTKDGQVKLIDFGAARYATTSHSRSLTVIIKPGYSPEEQYRSRGDQGPHTDVYALGATLYKMITGVTPPDAMERRAKYESQSKDILVPPQKNVKGLSVTRRNAILNAMNVRIEDRTPDVETLIKELNADKPAKLITGKIKKIDVYAWPLWLKIVLPVLGVAVLTFGTLIAAGVIRIGDRYSSRIVMPSDTVRVPDVEGLSSEEAITRVESSKLNAVAAGNAVSEYIAAGHIVLQEPVAGTYVPVNSQVKVTISAGNGVIPPFNGTATVPYLAWDTLADAKEKLMQAGLTADSEVEEAYDDNVEEGKVISADKEAGSTLPVNSVLKLTVSKGAEPFLMPDVSGMKEADARKQLEEKGLQVIAEYVSGSKEDIGKVIGQDKKNITVRKGDTVMLTVSAATVPNVVGKTPTEAEKILKAQGFSVSVNTITDGNEKTWGQVSLQEPAAGALTTEPIILSINIPKQGDTITFGNYWQSSDKKKEPIEWIVLDTEGSKVFVTSRYVLDVKPYNHVTEYTAVTWETCTLRNWLNGSFYNNAFSSAEKGRIQTTTVKNDNNPTFGTAGGNSTSDKIFLLSISEVNKYLSDHARICYPTQYAKNNGCDILDSGDCFCWLRSPGSNSSNAAVYGGEGDARGTNGVRPAMWINLDPDAASTDSSSNVPSAEARLSSLNVVPGNWNRTFDPNVTAYTIDVGADTDSLTFQYSAMDSNCSIAYWPYSQPGKINVQKGTTNFYIKVTAQDGKTTKTYSLIIVRP